MSPVTECCLIKFLRFFLSEKYIHILALEMATHGTGSVPVVSARTVSFPVISQLLCLLGRRKRETFIRENAS